MPRRTSNTFTLGLGLTAVALLSVGLTCTPKQTGSTRPRVRTSTYFRPQTVASALYNEAIDPRAPEGEIEALMLDLVTQIAVSNGRAAPQPDPRLAASAQDLAITLTDDRPPGYDVIEFALQHHGIIEPSPHLLVVEMTPGGEDALIVELKERLPKVIAQGRYRRFGAGSFRDRDADRVRVVLALQESFVETDPIPRELPHGGALQLRGRLLFPYRNAKVYVTPVRGAVETVPLVKHPDGGFSVWIRCGDADGRQQVEIGGEDKVGSEVLANFPVYCGSEPPKGLTALASAGSAVSSAEEAEELALQLLNADRLKAGLLALLPDARVAAVARLHSRDMLENDFVGHVSPTTGTASDRLRRAGLGSATVLENVARTYSPEEAEVALMGSPGHRQNILNPDVTHVGIGMVLGREVAGRAELLQTQVFVLVPGKLDPARASEDVRAVIDGRRKAASLRSLAGDSELTRLAQVYARALGSGEPRREASTRLDEGLDRLGNRFALVKTNVMVVGAVSQIASSKSLQDRDISHVGIGVFQGRDPEIGEQALFVVMLLARAR